MKLKATRKKIADNFAKIYLIEGNRNLPKCKLLPKSAQKVVDEYKKKSNESTFEEQQKLDKEYLDKFIEALLND